jgi:hypothetical protein
MKEEILERRAGGNGQMKPGKGVEFRRYYTRGRHIAVRHPVSGNIVRQPSPVSPAEVIFEQKNVEVPKTVVR